MEPNDLLALEDDFTPEELQALIEPDDAPEEPLTEQQLQWQAERIAIAEALGVTPDRVVVNEQGRPLTRADLILLDLGDDDE